MFLHKGEDPATEVAEVVEGAENPAEESVEEGAEEVVEAEEKEAEPELSKEEKKEKIANEGKEEVAIIAEVVEEVSSEDSEEEKNEGASETSKAAEKRVESVKHEAEPKAKVVEVAKSANYAIPPVLAVYTQMKQELGEPAPKKKDKNFAFIKKEEPDVKYKALAEKNRSVSSDKRKSVMGTFGLNDYIVGYTYHQGKKQFVPGVAVRLENISTEIVTKPITIEVEFHLDGEIYDRIASKVDYNDNYYLVPAFFQRRTLTSKNGVKSMKHAMAGLEAKIYLNDVLLATKSVDKKEVLDWSFKD